nr:secoisolariciresinol dehydrogenase-like [Ipomoea batatas]
MFSNAGVVEKGGEVSILDSNYDNLRNVFDANVLGAFLCAKHAARVMIPARKGSVVFTSSVASVTHGDVPHEYTASKHTVVGIDEKEKVEEYMCEIANLKEAQLGAKDVAEAALYLASDKSNLSLRPQSSRPHRPQPLTSSDTITPSRQRLHLSAQSAETQMPIAFGVLTCVVSCDRRPPVRYAKAAIKAALAMKILQPQIASRNMKKHSRRTITTRSRKESRKSKRPTSAQPSSVSRRSGSRRHSTAPPLSAVRTLSGIGRRKTGKGEIRNFDFDPHIVRTFVKIPYFPFPVFLSPDPGQCAETADSGGAVSDDASQSGGGLRTAELR